MSKNNSDRPKNNSDRSKNNSDRKIYANQKCFFKKSSVKNRQQGDWDWLYRARKVSKIKGKGLETGGIKIRNKQKIINAGPITTFNNYSIISENRCFIVPKRFPLKQSVIFGCAVPTGAGIILNEIKPRPKDSIAIYLNKLGFNKHYIKNVYTSGDAALDALEETKFGKYFYHLGPRKDDDLFTKFI